MAKGTILIVEDDDAVREVMKLQLEQEGYPILEARNGREALRMLHQEDLLFDVHLILCDIRMPDINGEELINIMNHQSAKIPIIAITGYPNPEMAAHFLEDLGVKMYLVKPLEKKELIAVVREWDDFLGKSRN